MNPWTKVQFENTLNKETCPTKTLKGSISITIYIKKITSPKNIHKRNCIERKAEKPHYNFLPPQKTHTYHNEHTLNQQTLQKKEKERSSLRHYMKMGMEPNKQEKIAYLLADFQRPQQTKRITSSTTQATSDP